MNKSKKAIQRLATQLLNQSNIKKPPVKVENIAKFLGIKISFRPYKGNSDISGILIRDASQVVIGVNAKHHEHRQRFSVAHEIGHYLLHEGDQVFVDREYKVNFRDSNSSLGTNLQEVEANFFASLILIPEDFLINDLKKYEIDIETSDQIEQLAKDLSEKYNVSPTSMMLRLSQVLS